jgi:pyruvate kinase
LSPSQSRIFAPSEKRRRRTKIICTLGPSSTSFETIAGLARAGMNCARLNFSHGTLRSHLQSIKTVRSVSEKLGKFIAIMQDLPGPKIRVGIIPGGMINLKRGQIVDLVPDGEDVDSDAIPVHQLHLAKYVPVGATIFLADGTIRLEVIGKTGDRVKCRCLNSGSLLSGKGINIPQIQRSFRGFTDLDKEYLKFGVQNEVDLVAVSFVRTAKEMQNVRQFIKSRTSDPPWIISKIERREAVENALSVIKASDAVMVARGDLGVENPIEQVPVIQKMIISECNQEAIPVITATQMLESMVTNPRPTRAEATDVANAVLDGTDALMLSEETAVGSYPIECVKVLDRVARVAERWVDHGNEVDGVHTNTRRQKGKGLSQATSSLATQKGAKLIVCSTKIGALAKQIARERPDAEIIAITKSRTVANRLEIVRDVFPLVTVEEIGREASMKTLENSISKIILQNHIARSGDKIVFARNDSEYNGSPKQSELLISLQIP